MRNQARASAVLPALAPLFREHPRLRADISVREMRELASVIERGGADFVLLDRTHEAPGLEHVPLEGQGPVLFAGNHPNSLLDPALIIAFGAFVSMAICVAGSLDGVDRGLIRMAESFGLPRGAVQPGMAL